jgi:hypothetical protein
MGGVCGSAYQADQGRGFLYQQRGVGFLRYGELFERAEEEVGDWLREIYGARTSNDLPLTHRAETSGRGQGVLSHRAGTKGLERGKFDELSSLP